MKRLLKILLILIGIILLGIGALLAYVKTALPKVSDPPEMTIERTPERIARGEYLANYVFMCIDCHSHRDWGTFGAPMVAGTEGKGGEVFDENLGFPGSYISANITPAGIGDWTDGELYRAITTGVSKDGHALFPIMPYQNFGQMDPEDIKSVIAYIRTIPSIEYTPKKSRSNFPMNFIINTIPKDPTPGTIPSKDDKIKYGEYLVMGSSCRTCHTIEEKGELVGPHFGGGREFRFPDNSVLRSANITPHATGIGNWTEDVFVQKFRQYIDSTHQPIKVEPGQFQTMMPWYMYARMTDEDLRAIYAYLKSVTPVENVVVKFDSPPTQ